MLEKKITFDSFIRGIITILIIIGVLYLVNYLSGVLLPFFVAWLIAYMAYPMVTFFQYKLKLKNRVVSIILTMIVILTVLTLAFVLLVPPIIDEFGKLKELLRAYFIEGSKQAAIPGTVENFIKEHGEAVFNRFFTKEKGSTLDTRWETIEGLIKENFD